MFRTIVIERFGTFLGKRGERLLIRTPAAKPALQPAPSAPLPANDTEPPAPRAREHDEEELPLFRVGEIVLPSRGVTLSTDLVEELARRGIPVTFVTRSGQPYAMLTSPMLTATIATRRAQLRAMDGERGAALARAFVAGKLRNQASLLVYFAKAEKDAPDRRAAALEAAADARAARTRALAVEPRGASPDRVREGLMGAEGLGGKAYWRGVRALLEGRVAFTGAASGARWTRRTRSSTTATGSSRAASGRRCSTPASTRSPGCSTRIAPASPRSSWI